MMPEGSPQPRVLSINISPGGIPKFPVASVRITERGLEGDGHDHQKHYRLEQAVSLQDIEMLKELQQEGYPLEAGTTGENLTVCALHVNRLPIGTRLAFDGGVVLEVSKIRKPCYVLDSINPQLKKDIVDRCGIYAKVISEGTLAQDTAIYISETTSSE